jgi:hypothetical protein
MPYTPINASNVLHELSLGNEVRNRKITGPLIRPDTEFQHPVRFYSCDFGGDVDLTRCRFARRVEFVGCYFRGLVKIRAAVVNGDCEFRAVIFGGDVDCDRLTVRGKLEVRAPSWDDLTGKVAKDEAPEQDAGYDLRKRPYVRFWGLARFSQMQVDGEANFGSAQFFQYADFYNAKISGPAFFRIDRFKPDPHSDAIDFPPVRFYGGARFRDVNFGGEVNFRNAEFWGNVDFTLMRVGGQVFFRPEAYGADPGRFPRSSIRPTVFHSEAAPQKTSVEDGPKQPKGIGESEPAGPEGKDEEKCLVDFSHARLGSSVELAGVGFGDDPKSKRMVVQWDDCVYGGIDLKDDDLDEFIKVLKRQKFERSAWLQLESVLRKQGDEKGADKVYRERMSREGRELSLPRGLGRALWWVTSGYGTRPLLVLFWCAVICCVGWLVFACEGVLEYDPPLSVKSYRAALGTDLPKCGDAHDALEVSLYQFVPIKLPFGEDCRPTGAAHWAAFMRVIGSILVPLLGANLAGLLHRKAKPQEPGQADE